MDNVETAGVSNAWAGSMHSRLPQAVCDYSHKVGYSSGLHWAAELSVSLLAGHGFSTRISGVNC